LKPSHFGWLLVLGLLIIGLVAVALSPKWSKPATAQQRIIDIAKEALKQPPAPEPGEGKVTNNLSRAMRLKMPILAIFSAHQHVEMSGPDRLALAAREKAERAAYRKLAADYNGVLSVITVSVGAAPATAVRAKVRGPAVIVYGEAKETPAAVSPGPPPEHPELWRQDGELSVSEIRAKLAALNIKPKKATPGQESPGASPTHAAK
jgi:hypothetical protein